jgi:uncharacterized protein involved in tolerance to divalent cations
MIKHITQYGNSFSFAESELQLIFKGLKTQLVQLYKKMDKIESGELPELEILQETKDSILFIETFCSADLH